MFNTLTKFATNDELVESLNVSVVTKDAMKQVNRRIFVNDWSHYLIDKPQRIMKDMVRTDLDKTTLENQTISAPTMHANAIEYLKNSLRKGAIVLDVGSGSGYLTVCFAKMVHDKRIPLSNEGPGDKGQGKVIGIDVHPELIEYSQKIIDENYPLEKPIVSFQVGSAYDFYEDHLEEYFDAINVGATALELPQNLVRLLKKGGQMVIPLKRFDGSEIFTLVEKDMNGHITKKELMNVVYVPLVK